MTLARPSILPLGGLLRMTFFLNAIINLRHPEEARSAVSKDARRACRVEMRQPTETAALHRGWLYTPTHDAARRCQAVFGPVVTGFMEVFGLKRTILLGMILLVAGTGLSIFMTEPWQLFLSWGFMVGIGCAGAVGITAAVANRWFAERNGLAMGLLFAATAAGQIIFLPFLALLAGSFGWEAVSLAATLSVAAMLPVGAVLPPESPAQIEIGPYGSAGLLNPPPRAGNPFSIA